MSSANSADITKNVLTFLAITADQWSCSADSIRTKGSGASEPASTTGREARAGKKPVSLKPGDPYPTWPFTRVEPKSLARWCKKNVGVLHNIEEAPF